MSHRENTNITTTGNTNSSRKSLVVSRKSADNGLFVVSRKSLVVSRKSADNGLFVVSRKSLVVSRKSANNGLFVVSRGPLNNSYGNTKV